VRRALRLSHQEALRLSHQEAVAAATMTGTNDNYLYDIRPHKTLFALYAAVQSATSALLVFCGGIAGGYLARYSPAIADWIAPVWQPASALFIVFIATSLLRVSIAAWFLPRLTEPVRRRRPELLQLVFRVVRISASSGLVLDWMSVIRKRQGPADPEE